jgi:glutamate racemase
MRIGVFDSGLGGLTVVKQIKKILPEVQIIYLGDTARVPYGTRSPEIINKFSGECANFLEQKNIEMLVIACNTSSAYAFEKIQKEAKMPVYEMISWGVKEAWEKTKNGKIGVIGTRATIYSHKHKNEISNIWERACPLFVPLVEEGEIEGEIIEGVVNKYLGDMPKEIDTLILGCTHYPVLAGVIRKVVGGEVALVDPGERLAKELSKLIKINELSQGDEYYFTDMNERYLQVAQMFLGEKIMGKVQKISL